MRDLTKEELKLAPDWATHYYAYADGDILFECDSKFALYDKGRGLMSPSEGCRGVCSESALLNRKPFDITEHELFTSGILMKHKNGKDLYVNYLMWKLDKDRAIAIAKALGVTGEDLK